MRHNYILDGENKTFSGNYAGPKARNDLIQIFSDCRLAYLVDGRGIGQLLHYLKLGLQLRLGADRIIVQYPFGVDNKLYRGFAKYLVPKKAVLWIHDVGALRNQGDARAAQKEINLFNQFDTVVAHNPAMIRWLKENGCRSRLLNLQIFDYLTDCPLGAADPAEKRRVHFAGNLSREKSGFLYTSLCSLNSLEICLYGGGYDGQAEGLHYMGSFPPEELPGKLKGGFGLVWDGTSIETCDGNTGNYLWYNDPHKTSLYLAAGIPVILWSQAAMAPFIRDNGLGITVDSLVDLDKAIDGVSDESYRQMLANCAAAARRLRSGWYARQIWDQM